MDEFIEREALITKFKKMELGEHGLVERLFADGVYAVIAAFPAADVAPVVHGRIVGSLEDGRYRRRFSCCGEDATMITQWTWPKYCPNCGAKMDGGEINGS